MSHYECNKCHGRFRDEHECPADGEMLLTRIIALEEMLRDAQERILELGSRVSSLESRAGGQGDG